VAALRRAVPPAGPGDDPSGAGASDATDKTEE